MGMNDINSLSHSKWNCKYHIVFAPKYRRKVFYKAKRAAIGKILRELCEWKGLKIIEAEAGPDHVHLFVEIPPKYSISGFMGYLKGKSAAKMYEQFGELKYERRGRRPHREFCVSVFRQNQEYHVFNVHDGGLFPLVTSLPEGWDGMRADTA